MAGKQRSIINWTDEQHVLLEKAVRLGGYPSIPAYVKVQALSAAKKDTKHEDNSD